MIVRAINVREPWASMIFKLGKNVENRSFRLRAPDGSPYTGPLAIVASASCSVAEYVSACNFALEHCKVTRDQLPAFETLELGGLVGVTNVTGYLEPDAFTPHDWHMPDSWGWQLADSVALPFRRVRGRQGPFQLELTDAETAALRAAGLAA